MADPGETRRLLLSGRAIAGLEGCLGGLSPEFRSVVLLVDLQGMDYTEAAQVIGAPLGTVKSRLARARLRLRECLQDVWELLPARFRLGERVTNEHADPAPRPGKPVRLPG